MKIRPIQTIVIMLIVLCLFSTVQASGPYSEKAKAQHAARVQKSKERKERIQAFYTAKVNAYRALLGKCTKCNKGKSFICNKYR